MAAPAPAKESEGKQGLSTETAEGSSQLRISYCAGDVLDSSNATSVKIPFKDRWPTAAIRCAISGTVQPQHGKATAKKLSEYRHVDKVLNISNATSAN